MVKSMRRIDKQLEAEKIFDVIERGEYGVLATTDKDNQPYGIPLSYVYYDSAFYFHSALIGHKIDNIEVNNKASFTIVVDAIIDNDSAPKKLTTNYKSVIAFGKVTIVNDEQEKLMMIGLLMEKFFPQYIDLGVKRAQKAINGVKIFKLNIEYMTGKHQG